MRKIIDDCVTAVPVLAVSRDEFEALQLRKQKWAIRYAYGNVAMYKNKYDKAGVHPDDLKHLDDLVKFPFTAKEDLRKSNPFDIFAVPMKNVVRIHEAAKDVSSHIKAGIGISALLSLKHLEAFHVRKAKLYR